MAHDKMNQFPTLKLIPNQAEVDHSMIQCITDTGEMFYIDFGMSYTHPQFNDLKVDMSKVKFIILTHAHDDHWALILLLKKLGFKGNVLCTYETAEMINASISDNVSIQARNAKLEGKKPLYDMDDAKYALSCIRRCNFNKPIKTPINGVTVWFFKNAHLRGAAYVLIQYSVEGKEATNLLCTGDLKLHNELFDVDPLPEWVLDLPLTVLIESTYGDSISFSNKENF